MRYFLCDKCGESVLFVPKGEGPGGMCMTPIPARASGICGGGFTVELIKKTNVNPVKYVKVQSGSSLAVLERKKARFLASVGKVKLTPAVVLRKSAQLKRINEGILNQNRI